MNKIYRLVWNKSLNLWMIVSEIARGSCKKRNITVSFPQKTNVEKNQNIESVSFKVATLPQAFQTLGITVLLPLSFVISSSAYAATYTGSQTCSAGAGVGPDGINRPTDTNPVNGSGTWSNVVGCNAKGNNHLGVQVVGAYASATGAGATVMGFGSEATTRATAYGMQAQASGTQSTAVGSWAQASGVGSVAMGTDGLSNSRNSGARASGNQAVAIAGRAIAAGDQSIAIGHNSNANGDGDIALGRDASAKGVTENGTIYTATALGASAQAEGKNTTAVGQNSKATKLGASAFGGLAEATAEYSSALGNGAKATANFATATGNQANASAVGATVAGSNSVASGELSSGFGALVQATGNKSTAVGTSARSKGASSVSVGDNSQAQGDNDIALGRNAATASGGSNNIAVGNGVTTGSTGQNVAMGSGTTTANAGTADGGAVAIGRDQKAAGDGAVAIGDPNNANGNGAVAVGRNNTAAGNDAASTAADGAVALGNENKAIGQGSVALGNRSTAAAAGALALGDAANAQALRGVALGSNAVATNADDVALGAGSQTSTATGAAYRTGTAAPASVVSVGTAGNERRIQNLSDGAADTDAVNVRQLKNVQDGVDQLGESTADALGGGSSYDPATGAVTAPNYNVNGNTVNNVGEAITALDKGWTLQSNGENDGAVKAGDTVDIGTADGEENLKVAKEGNDIKYSLNRDLKVDGVTAGDTVINNDGMTITGGPSVTKSGIDAAGNKVTNVADGTEASDAVNKGQLDKAGQDLTDKGFGLTAQDGSTVQKKLGEAVDVVGADENITTKVQGGKVAIELAKDLNVNSIKAGDTTINNDGLTIANGPSVTKSGIDAAGNKVTNVADGTEASDAVNKGQLDKAGQDLTDKGFGLTAQDGTTVQKKLGEAVDVVGADENITTKVQDGKVAIELAKDLNVNSVKAGDTTIHNDGMTIANGPSVTKSGIDAAGNKVTNVADGTEASDAVNKGQLDKAGQDLTDKGFGLTAQDGTTVQKKLGEAVDVVGADENITTKVQDGKVAIELAKDLNVNSVKAGDTTIHNDGMTITDGPSVTKSGIDAAGNKVTNVAEGTEASDAVNKGQLDKAGQDLTDKGFGLTAQDGTTVQKKLGEAVGVVGADENITTKVQDGKVAIELAKDLNVNSIKAGDTTINNDGISITGGPSVTKTGIDAAGNKISNVAAGTEGTDAVNKDQLDNAAAASKTEVTEGKNITVTKTTGDDGQDIYNVATADDVEFNNVKVGDVSIDGTTGKISGVTDGTIAAGSKEAVNGGQLHGVADSVKNAIGGETVLNPNGSITTTNVGNTGQNNIHDAIDSVRGAAVAAKTTVTEGDNIVVTESKNADGSTNYDVATAKDVKFDSVTATDEDGNETVLTATGTQVKDGEGNEAEYGAKGIKLKDQEGKGIQLNQEGLSFVDATGASIGPSITAGGINAGNTIIGGVAAGRVAADSQDAINGSQLHGVADSVKNIIGGNTTVNPDGTLSGSNIGGTGKDNINDAIGAVGKAAQEAKTTVSEGKNIVVKESKNADGSTDYEVSTSADLEVDSVTAGGTKVDGNGLTIEGGPSVTKEGIDAGDKKVTGVANGTVAKDSKDAVNGGQLHGVADSVKNVVGGNATVNPDGTITTKDVGGTGHNNINDAIASVKQDAKSAKTTVSNKDDNLTVTESKNSDGSTDYEVGLAKDIKVDSVTAKDVNATQVNVAGDKGSTTITGGGISITGPKGEAGPSMTTDGINAGGKKVTGVADGAIRNDSQEAINGSQLHKSYQDVGSALGGGAGYDPEKGWKGPTYNVAGGSHNNVGDALGALNNANQALDNRITNLGDQMQQAFYDTNRRIDDVEKKANAGVAAAIALEAAPFVAGKYTYAVGAAYHGGENAFGATLRKTADNGRWSLTGGVAAASQGDPSFRLGLSGVID